MKGSPTFYKLREWAVDSYSAAAVEALLRDGHGPKEPPQIGHDLLSAAVFLVLAKPDSSCTATSLAPLISLATTVHKLIVRLTHPFCVDPTKAAQASASAAASAAVAARTSTAEIPSEQPQEPSRAVGEGLFHFHTFPRNDVGFPDIGSLTRGLSDNTKGGGKFDSDMKDAHGCNDIRSPSQLCGLSLEESASTSPSYPRVKHSEVCTALLQLRALMMMGVMRLSEWHAWGGHTARQLLRQMLVVKSVLQSSIGCIHALLLQLQVAPSGLDAPPFQLRLCPSERVTEGSKRKDSSTSGRHSSSDSTVLDVNAVGMELQTSEWEQYSREQLRRPLFPGCCNPACSNLTGATEATLPTRLCACKLARYCSRECKDEGWLTGRHIFECVNTSCD